MNPVLRSSALWDAVFRNLPSGVLVLAPVLDELGGVMDFEVLAANERALDMAGLAEGELLGRRLGEFHVMFRQRSVLSRYERVLASETAQEFEQMLPLGAPGRVEPGWYGITAIPADGRLIVILNSVTRRKAALMEAVRMMSADDLTGIGNRRLLKSQFWRRRQMQAGMSLVYFDLDGFKTINDTYGHETGDEVLKIVAQRLKNSLRPDEAVARLGGDEFAVLLDTDDELVATGIAVRLCEAITRPIRLDQITVGVDTSVGVAVYPRDGASFEALCATADQRMYRHKQGRLGARRPAAGFGMIEAGEAGA